MHTLLVYEPGHFHAALLLAVPAKRIDPRIHVYATPGPDLNRFLALIDGFNTRPDPSTDWHVELHTDGDPLTELIAEHRGDVVIVAGRNKPKLAAIARLHDAGFNVLADKPWLTTSGALADLDRATGGPPQVADIMTQRHEPLARLRRRIVATESVFGRFPLAAGQHAIDARPALEFSSVHHLCKLVDGRPLQRPEWYYDVGVQGDGLVDIQSHMVDQAQWLIDGAGGSAVLDGAGRWSTPVPLDVFIESTGLTAFPLQLLPAVRDGVLHLACNGRIDYRLRGVRVRQRAEWRTHTPAGGGDIHRSIARGTHATVTIDHGAQTGYRSELHVGSAELRPVTDASADDLDDRLSAALADWRAEFPGLRARPSPLGFELVIPDATHLSHEATFAVVLSDFLDRVDSDDWSVAEADTIRTRYRLLAQAQAQAGDGETVG